MLRSRVWRRSRPRECFCGGHAFRERRRLLRARTRTIHVVMQKRSARDGWTLWSTQSDAKSTWGGAEHRRGTQPAETRVASCDSGTSVGSRAASAMSTGDAENTRAALEGGFGEAARAPPCSSSGGP